jgi:hypothetical protein
MPPMLWRTIRSYLSPPDADGHRLCSVNKLWPYAEICYVANGVQPYLGVLA